MKNIDGYRWPKFESLFSESFDDTSYGREDFIGSFSEVHEPEARTVVNPSSWLLGRGGLFLVRSDERRFLDALMYQLVESAAREHTVYLFLSKLDRYRFLRGFVEYLTLLGCEEGADDLRERYERAKEKIATMDLEIHELCGCPIEELRELINDQVEYESVMIFDSLMSLTSKATDKWMLSRGIIAVRLREYLEDYIGVRSIAVFEQAFPGIDYKDTYASFDSYLDGSIYMYRGDIRSIDYKAYWEVKINLHAHHGVSTETFQVLDYRTNQLLDDWPDFTKTPPAPDDQSSATPDDIPF